MRGKPGVLLLLWCLCAAVVGTVLSLVSGVNRALLLRAESSVTIGTVVSAQPHNHASVTVRYLVNDKEYERTSSPYNWPVGTNVTVYYSPKTPQNSLLVEPAEFISQQLPSLVLGTLLVSAFLTAQLFLGKIPRRADPLWRTVWSPRVAISMYAVGVLIGTGAAIAYGQMHGIAWFTSGLFLLGCAVFLREVWSQKTSWTGMLRSKPSWIGAALLIVGNVLRYVF
jgi:hypothetical protein